MKEEKEAVKVNKETVLVPDVLGQRMNCIRAASGKPVLMVNVDRENIFSLIPSAIQKSKRLFTVDELKAEKFLQKNLMEPTEFLLLLGKYMTEEDALVQAIGQKLTVEDKKHSESLREFYLGRAEAYFNSMLEVANEKIKRAKEVFKKKIEEILSLTHPETLKSQCVSEGIKTKNWGEMSDEEFYREMEQLVGQVALGESVQRLFTLLKLREKNKQEEINAQVVSSLTHRVSFVSENLKRSLNTMLDGMIKIMEDSTAMLNFNLTGPAS